MDIRGIHRDEFLRSLRAAYRKQDCGIRGSDFVVTFTNEGEEKIFSHFGDISESQLLDACLYIKRVRSRGPGTLKVTQLLETSRDPVPSLEDLRIASTHNSSLTPLFHAIKSKKLPKFKSLSLSAIDISNDEDGELLAGGIASSDLFSLKVLRLHNIQLRGGHFTLAKAMESGKMLTLERLELSSTSLGDDGCEAYSTAVRSGNLPALLVIDFECNQIGNRGATALGNVIRFGKLTNLARLNLQGNEITDEGLIALLGAFQVRTPIGLPNLRNLDLSKNQFTEQILLRLVKALELGYLNSFHHLSFDDNPGSEKAAEAFVSALVKNKYLVVDSHVNETSLRRRKERLLERNSRNKGLLLGIGGAADVSAEFSKVYLCGHPEVGKTTFRHTLETVQMSRLKALMKRRSFVEGRTRGIEVSPILTKSISNKSGENPTTLLVWDMAGQEEYELLHTAFFQDSDSAEGKATTFLIVCSLKSVRNNLEESRKQLVYWLRFIASSCNRNAGNPRHVLTVLNNFLPIFNLGEIQKYWQHVLEDQREKFAGRLDIQTNPFIGDIRKASFVKDIKKSLSDHSRDSLKDEKVPKICHLIQENLSVWSELRKQFPVLRWEDFMTLIRKTSSEQWSEETLEADRKYLWPEKVLEAATKYLHEAGALIFIYRKFPSDWGTSDRKLVVLSPTWFCSQVVGDMYLHQDMAFPAQQLFRKKADKKIGLFRMKVDRKGRISEEAFKKFFKSSLKLGGEWSETELEDLIEILMWFGLCYKGRNKDLFIPSLIEEIGTPEVRWGPCNSPELGQEEWVMGFSVEHHKNDLTIAPIALWHRYQVELAQSPTYNDRPDNDFVCSRYSVTFSVNFMVVLIKVNVNKVSPIFYDVNIFVKPLLHENDCSIKQRRQLQVDLASDLVEVLLGLWEEVCPGVEYLQRVVWPWPASSSGFHVNPDRNLDVEEAKELVRKHGLGWRMHWEVGTNGAITVDQLLSTKDKDEVMKNYLFIVREGVVEAVQLKIFPDDTVSREVAKEAALPSYETEEENQPISPSSKLVLDKLDKMDKKNDQHHQKLNERLDNVESLIRDGFSTQRELLQKIYNTVQLFSQDKERTCPRFIYVGERNSGVWMALKDALSSSVTFRLQFACEAQFNDYKVHKVSNQEGIDVSELKGWVGKIAPWLKMSLTVLVICAKIGANFVAPGLGLILPDFGESAKVSWLSQGIASATGFTKDELDKLMIQGLGLDANPANWDPREVYGKSREAICKFLEQKLTPKAFEGKFRLRKVCLSHPESSVEDIVWICPECFEKYKMSSISIREL